jgi:hypothetical protein
MKKNESGCLSQPVRRALATLCLGAAALAAGCGSDGTDSGTLAVDSGTPVTTPPQVVAKKPNILFIMADDLVLTWARSAARSARPTSTRWCARWSHPDQSPHRRRVRGDAFNDHLRHGPSSGRTGHDGGDPNTWTRTASPFPATRAT